MKLKPKNITSRLLLFLFFFQTNIFSIEPGAYQIQEYINILKNKKVSVVANHASTVEGSHLVDTLLKLEINIIQIFSPEHGFRGKADAGEKISNEKDQKTGLPIVSLYANNFKPSAKDISSSDVVVFDLQDVGVRFYTYISTLHYVMEACAENSVPLIVLDRPNPNGHYIDGPILRPGFKTFVGLHPVPIVYGMTIGEFAKMINGEGWLQNNAKCDLRVIKCKDYNHNSRYVLPINPSPNLNSMQSVYLYPSTGLFEGTCFSVGRGTLFPFRLVGHPKMPDSMPGFTPQSIESMSTKPPFLNQRCNGLDLRNFTVEELSELNEIKLDWLIEAYNVFPDKNNFFRPFFNNLAGQNELMEHIKTQTPISEIKKSWENDLDTFKAIRKKYLLYQ